MARQARLEFFVSWLFTKIPVHLREIMDEYTKTASSCKVVSAANVAKELLAEVKQGLLKLEKVPLLVGFLANNDPAARKYAEWTDRTCQEK